MTLSAITPATGIMNLLRTAGWDIDGGSTGWTIIVGKLSSSPDQLIALMDTGGTDPHPSLTIDYPNVQAIVRGGKGPTGYTDAYQKILDIQTRLLGIPGQPTNYPELTMLVQRGGINTLGYDAQDRPMFSVNFRLITEPEAPANGHRDSL